MNLSSWLRISQINHKCRIKATSYGKEVHVSSIYKNGLPSLLKILINTSLGKKSLSLSLSVSLCHRYFVLHDLCMTTENKTGIRLFMGIPFSSKNFQKILTWNQTYFLSPFWTCFWIVFFSKSQVIDYG